MEGEGRASDSDQDESPLVLHVGLDAASILQADIRGGVPPPLSGIGKGQGGASEHCAAPALHEPCWTGSWMSIRQTSEQQHPW